MPTLPNGPEDHERPQPTDSIGRAALAAERSTTELGEIKRMLASRTLDKRIAKAVDKGVFWGGLKLYLLIVLLAPVWMVLIAAMWVFIVGGITSWLESVSSGA